MLSNNNILLLTQNFKKLNVKNNYLSVLPISDELKKKINIKEINFVLPTKKQVLDKYEFCNEIYKNIIKKLLKIFNEIHEVDFKEKEFEIIIGYWLKNYIYQSLKIFQQLEYIFLNKKIDSVLLNDCERFNFIKENTQSFAEAHALDLDWYYCYFSKIIHFFEKNFSKKMIIKNVEVSINNHQKKIKGKKNFYENILYFIQRVPKNSNNAFISHTYLPFFQEKKLELIFNQIPNYYNTSYYKNDLPINTELRKRYSNLLISKDKNLENFIYSNIFNFIPKSFLENFKYNLKMSKSNSFPKNPNFIFTSSLNFFDEIFKVYAACQMKNNSSIFIGQHGNNYFSKIHNNYLPEFNYATKFLSWGYESSRFKNVIGLFNFTTLKKNVIKKSLSRKKIVIFFDFLSTVSDNLFYNPQEIRMSLSRIEKFLISLKKEIKDNIVLRINNSFYKKIYGLTYSNYFKNFEVEIDDGEKDSSKLLKQAKLCVFNYDSTGFLENTCNNLPSIMLLGKNYLNFINDDFEKKYKNLINNKLIFLEGHQLANHINDIWNEVDIWWESKAVQDSLNRFNYQFNERGNSKSLKLISSIIKKNL